MASAADLKDSAVRMLLAGYPSSGKTGAIAALLNVGYKVRMIDFEGNYEPLINFTDERALANLDIVTVQDKFRISPEGDLIVDGIPTAFNDGIKLMQEWTYKDATGEKVSLGASKDWGRDTVVVVDGLTSLGEAALRRAMKMMNKTPKNMTSAVWGFAVADALNFIKAINRRTNNFHVIFLAHLSMIGPNDYINQNDDKDENAAIKAEKMEAVSDGLIPVRLYPKGVTKNQSTTIHKEFPIMLRAEQVSKQGKTVRVLKTIEGPAIDLKFPAKDTPKEVPLETGLATLFEKLGAKAPGF